MISSGTPPRAVRRLTSFTCSSALPALPSVLTASAMVLAPFGFKMPGGITNVRCGPMWAMNCPRFQPLTKISARFSRSERENRALIFVNGWNMGQFIAHIGPQRTFVIPPGILNPNGANTIALAVTTDGKAGNALEPVKLVNLRTARGGVPLEIMPGSVPASASLPR